MEVAVQAHPNSVEVLSELGNGTLASAQEKNGNQILLKKATQLYQAAVHLDPTRHEAPNPTPTPAHEWCPTRHEAPNPNWNPNAGPTRSIPDPYLDPTLFITTP